MQRECSISIITINYNGFEDTCALLESIPQSDGIEIIVVDNASANDEASAIEARYPLVTVVRSQENLGFAGGNNLGIRASHGKYLFFVNNDTEFFIPDSPLSADVLKKTCQQQLQALADRLESSPQTGVVCPKIRFAWGDHPIQYTGYTALSSITMRNHSIGFGEPDSGQYDTPHPTPYAHGAAMMVKREAVEKAGLMPECYFLYYEELDWSMMFRRAGYTIWYDPCFTIYHKESKTTGQGSPLRTYYITRNRLLFARRNISFPRRLFTYLYLLLPVAFRDLLKNLLHHQPLQAKAVLAGISDFFKNKQGFRPFNTQ